MGGRSDGKKRLELWTTVRNEMWSQLSKTEQEEWRKEALEKKEAEEERQAGTPAMSDIEE
jgi:hypothetical protein